MVKMTSERIPENSHWKCGCAREVDTFQCDCTCRLNQEWTLHFAKGSFSSVGNTVAVLFSSDHAGVSKYTFQCSDKKGIIGTFTSRDPTLTSPFTTGADSMGLDWMYDELLQSPDAFAHSSLERAALTVTVVKLRGIQRSQRARDVTLSHSLPSCQTTTKSHCDRAPNMDIEDDYIQIDHPGFYLPKIQPWKDWQPENVIATLSSLVESGPLLQMEKSIDPVSLYEFKLTTNHTLTISTRCPEVEAAWFELAESYRLQRAKGKDFPLSDVFCFLQTDMKLPIPPEEATALKECIQTLAMEAVKRLQYSTFTLLRDRSPVLQCELHIFTLCLRKEIKEQTEMLIQFWLDDRRYAWIYGQMGQVMTTETQTTVDLTVIQRRDKKQTGPKYQIFRHISELNEQGVFFCCEGLGYAGEILVLPKEATPPLFQQA